MADEKKLTREERLAQALRANLARRKARTRAEGEAGRDHRDEAGRAEDND